MSETRPTVSGVLVATIIESAPDRVRRRLDRSPDEATKWEWKAKGDSWQIDTGGETVKFAANEISALDQVSCTCLLTPNCFHVMACLTVLETHTEGEVSSEAEAELDARVIANEPAHEMISEKQRQTAQILETSIAKVLQVGIANAGVTLQAGLQRSVYQCRAVGLHKAASLGIRVMTGITQFRSRSPQADPPQLIDDVTELLETSYHLSRSPNPELYWIGTARREQFPVRLKRLYGLFAEPVVSRSGHAGAIAWFLGEDGNYYSASDVRPGDVQLARDAYRGGIEIGPLVQPGRQLARGLYVGSEMTASTDGRLGRGKKVKLVHQGESSWDTEAIERRFSQPLADQWQTVYQHASLPDDARPAGWDFTFVQGTVLGASGPDLLFQLVDGTSIRLGIANDADTLAFRGNLKMLSYAPGLRLRVIGRTSLAAPKLLLPMAVSNWDDGDSTSKPEQRVPTLELPTPLADRVMLGFDQLERKHIRNAKASPIVFPPTTESNSNNELAPLVRRVLSATLAGMNSPKQANVNSIAQETALLKQYGFATAAGLLHTLTHGNSVNADEAANTFLAVQLYLRACRNELARARATIDQ